MSVGVGGGVLSESVGDLPIIINYMYDDVQNVIFYLLSGRCVCVSQTINVLHFYLIIVFFQSTHSKIRGKAGGLIRRSLDPNSKKASSILSW